MLDVLDLQRGPIPAALIRSSGRSWWQVRYAGGKVISEWDTIPSLVLRNARGSRWEQLDKRGLRGVRLLCPNGRAAELETNRDYALFQFKIGGFKVGSGHYADAHLIGAVDDVDGNCTCFAWEMKERQLVGPFKDNVLKMAYRNVGQLSLANLELR